MTPSITACPPTRVSSPLSRMGIISICVKRRKKVRRDTIPLRVGLSYYSGFARLENARSRRVPKPNRLGDSRWKPLPNGVPSGPGSATVAAISQALLHGDRHCGADPSRRSPIRRGSWWTRCSGARPRSRTRCNSSCACISSRLHLLLGYEALNNICYLVCGVLLRRIRPERIREYDRRDGISVSAGRCGSRTIDYAVRGGGYPGRYQCRCTRQPSAGIGGAPEV